MTTMLGLELAHRHSPTTELERKAIAAVHASAQGRCSALGGIHAAIVSKHAA